MFIPWNKCNVYNKHDISNNLLLKGIDFSTATLTAGPTTCWMQQWRALKKEGMDDPDPRAQFLVDFEQFLEERLNASEEIILGMDVNEEDSPMAELKQIMSSMNLIDVHNHLHDENPAPTTYQWGTQQLDFLFISPGISF